ncbi:MAG: hypothetical protein R6V58_13605 [Planctomycetota bacterium]
MKHTPGMAALIVAASLTSAPGGARAAEAELWSPNPCVAIFQGPDYSGQNDAACSIRITGVRNGAFSGKVVVYAKGGTKLPEAKITDLKLKEGEAAIPAKEIEIRYALPTGSEKGRRFPGVRRPKRFDALATKPPADGTTHPVWVTVHVPKTAAAGEYQGTLTVADRKIPVALTVHPWALPDPHDYRVHVGLVESPESVALHYDVPLWSDRHFELIGASFDQMAKVGSKTIFIPLICHTNFGNSETMVRWIKDGDGYKHDFTIAEKYLDLYIERIGVPEVVCLYVWEPFSGGGYFGKKGRDPKPIQVSRVAEPGGKVTTMTGPIHAREGSETFWKPVFDGLRERLQARGLGDENIMIGTASDSRPTREVTAMFHKIAPYARWVLHSHGKATKLNGVPVGYCAHVWGVGSVPDPDKTPDRKWKKNYYYGWRNKFLRTVFPRYGGGNFVLNPPFWSYAPLGVYRKISEATLAANLRGFGRVGADFWPVLKSGRGRRSIVARYPKSSWGQLNLTTATPSVLAPGPDGAVSTVRFEMMREGLQEAEAKIFIERALLDKAARARLGGDFARECHEMLKERLRVFLKSRPPHRKKPDDPERRGWEWFAAESGWPERSARLYETAARVAARIGR